MNNEYLTLEQRRAKDALQKIFELKLKDGDQAIGENYRSYVEALPAMIVMNGMGQAFATVLSRSQGEKAREKAYERLYTHCKQWLCRQDGPYSAADDLMAAIVYNRQDVYLRAQVEMLAYLNWLKKFAQAYLPKGERE